MKRSHPSPSEAGSTVPSAFPACSDENLIEGKTESQEVVLSKSVDYFQKLSLEVLCHVLDYLPLRDVLKLEHLQKKLHEAVSMYLRVRKTINFTEGKLYGSLTGNLTDVSLGRLFSRCSDLQYVYGFHPVCISKRRTRGAHQLSIPGVIDALSHVPGLLGIEISNIFLLEAILTYMPHVEILGTFKNRDRTIPIPPMNRITLPVNPTITTLNLKGISLPELPRMDFVKHIHLHWVQLSQHPFKDFGAPMLETFVMANCAGPTNALKYVPLMTGLAAARSLSRLVLIRVPFLGGLIQHLVEDSWRMRGFRGLQSITMGACKHALEVDLGFLTMTCAFSLEELSIQPSLTKDSFFSALNVAEVHFHHFDALVLGFVDPFPESGKWTNEELVMHGLADITENPAMITDVGMKAAGKVFHPVRRLEIYNCPHLHYPTTWFVQAPRSWCRLTQLTLRRCHAIRLADFSRFITMLPVLESLHLEAMFGEPPKGCARVGLSAGTGLGVSSALVSNTSNETGNNEDGNADDEDEVANQIPVNNNNDGEPAYQEFQNNSGAAANGNPEETDARAGPSDENACNSSDPGCASSPAGGGAEKVGNKTEKRASADDMDVDICPECSCVKPKSGKKPVQKLVSSGSVSQDTPSTSSATAPESISNTSPAKGDEPLQSSGSANSGSTHTSSKCESHNTGAAEAIGCIPENAPKAPTDPNCGCVICRPEGQPVQELGIYLTKPDGTRLEPDAPPRMSHHETPPQGLGSKPICVALPQPAPRFPGKDPWSDHEEDHKNYKDKDEGDTFKTVSSESDMQNNQNQILVVQPHTAAVAQKGHAVESCSASDKLKSDADPQRAKTENFLTKTTDKSEVCIDSNISGCPKTDEVPVASQKPKEIVQGNVTSQSCESSNSIEATVQREDALPVSSGENKNDEPRSKSGDSKPEKLCHADIMLEELPCSSELVLDPGIISIETDGTFQSASKLGVEMKTEKGETEATLYAQFEDDNYAPDFKKQKMDCRSEIGSSSSSDLQMPCGSQDRAESSSEIGASSSQESSASSSGFRSAVKGKSKYKGKGKGKGKRSDEKALKDLEHCFEMSYENSRPAENKHSDEKVLKDLEHCFEMSSENAKPATACLQHMSHETFDAGVIDVNSFRGSGLGLTTSSPVSSEQISNVESQMINLDENINASLEEETDVLDSSSDKENQVHVSASNQSRNPEQILGQEEVAEPVQKVTISGDTSSTFVFTQSEFEAQSSDSSFTVENGSLQVSKEGSADATAGSVKCTDKTRSSTCITTSVSADLKEGSPTKSSTGSSCVSPPNCPMVCGKRKLPSASSSGGISSGPGSAKRGNSTLNRNGTSGGKPYKGKSLKGNKRSFVKHSNGKVSQSCQAVSEEIRETTKKAKENDEIGRRASTRTSSGINPESAAAISASSKDDKGSDSEKTVAGSSNPSEDNQGTPNAKQSLKRKPNTCDQATSTSDPVIEDDHFQVLMLRSRSLVTLTLHCVGVTDLYLQDCPSLATLQGTSCRVLRKVNIYRAPKLSRVSFAQCRKLDENYLVREVCKQPSSSSRLIFLRPLKQFHFENLEHFLFKTAGLDYHMCLIRDHSATPSNTAYNRTRIGAWCELFDTMNYDYTNVFHDFPMAREKRPLKTINKYPWGRSIYYMQGKNEDRSDWDMMTDIPWLQCLSECPDVSNPNLSAQESKEGLYSRLGKNHIWRTNGVDDMIADQTAELEEAQVGLYIHSVIVHVNTCDLSGKPTPDMYV